MRIGIGLAACAALALAPTAACAGVASLDDREVEALRVLISSDVSAQAAFSSVAALAEAALRTSPRPIPEITTQHRLLGDPGKASTQAAVRDFEKARALALTYRLWGNPQRLARAREILSAWAGVNRPTGRPIDETLLEPAVEAYDLVRGEIPEKERTSIDGWLKGVAEAEMASVATDEKQPYGYNHHSHRLKTVGLVAFAVGDERLQRWALDGFRRQIGDNLRADGSSLDLAKRDAMWYQAYDLEALVRLAIALERAGHRAYDFEAKDGASLRKAVAFLVPYATGEKTHAEWVHSKVRFDFARADNGERGHEVGQFFEPKRAGKAIALAECFEPGLAALAAKLAGRPGERFSSLRTLLNAVSRRRGML